MYIRPMRAEDKNRILEFERGAFPREAWQSRDFDQCFNTPGSKNYTICFENNNKIIVGYAFTVQFPGYTQIMRIAKDPNPVAMWSVLGIGTELMEQVLLDEDKLAKEQGRPFSICLYVHEANHKAIEFFKKFGFYHNGNDHAFIRMEAKALPQNLINPRPNYIRNQPRPNHNRNRQRPEPVALEQVVQVPEQPPAARQRPEPASQEQVVQVPEQPPAARQRPEPASQEQVVPAARQRPEPALQEQVVEVQKNQQAAQNPKHIKSRSVLKSQINMIILGGFITACGIAAIAIAFTLLNAATLGIAGLIATGLGVGALSAGLGLFVSNIIKHNKQKTKADTQVQSETIPILENGPKAGG